MSGAGFGVPGVLGCGLGCLPVVVGVDGWAAVVGPFGAGAAGDVEVSFALESGVLPLPG